jgi:hypothetical protein
MSVSWLKPLTFTTIFVWQHVTSVDVTAELQKKRKCLGWGGNFFPTLRVLRGFLYLLIVYPKKKIISDNHSGSMAL